MAGTGHKLFAAGDVIAATGDNSINTYISEQVVGVYANNSTRDAAFGGAGEPTLAEGMMCFVLAPPTGGGSGQLQAYSGSAWIAVWQHGGGGFKAVETGASQAISISGTTVTFASSRFASAPNVQVTQANTGGGASKVANVDAISTSSCRIFMLDPSNAFIAGDATWLATLEA